jgi:hypothetical protein
MEHDKDCLGCYTSRVAAEEGGVIVRDYLAHCSGCGADIQGDTQHTVGGNDYCRHCALAAAEKEEGNAEV